MSTTTLVRKFGQSVLVRPPPLSAAAAARKKPLRPLAVDFGVTNVPGDGSDDVGDSDPR